MKRLHKLILSSYQGPLALTFFIAIFILLMQFMWKKIDDIAGKGLEWDVLVELITYACAHLVSMGLPLAILVSSIMVMGNFSERSEFIAMKSIGMSLVKVLKPLTIYIIILSMGLFMYMNYVLPVANLKLKVLIKDIKEQKPALTIKENVFYNELDNYTIRIGKKNLEDNTLKDILIYDHSGKVKGNNKVIRAKRGKMQKTKDGRYLVLTLYDGVSYEEKDPFRLKSDKTHPLIRSSFKKQEIRFNLMDYKLSRTDENIYKSHYEMLGIEQLDFFIDSVSNTIKKRKSKSKKKLKNELLYYNDTELKKIRKANKERSNEKGRDTAEINGAAPLANLQKEGKNRVFKIAKNQIRNNLSKINHTQKVIENKKRMMDKYKIEWHRKLAISVSCIILFFIGAPLGALVKKGGLGVPVVLSTLMFILYYMVSIFGENIAESGSVPPWLGMWLSTFVLAPIAIIFTIKATSETMSLDITSIIKRQGKGLSN